MSIANKKIILISIYTVLIFLLLAQQYYIKVRIEELERFICNNEASRCYDPSFKDSIGPCLCRMYASTDN